VLFFKKLEEGFDMKKILIFFLALVVVLPLFALDNANVYQTARGIIADDVPVKTIARISDKDADYLYWFALYSTGAYDTVVEMTKTIMQFRKEDGIEYEGVGQNGFPTFNGVNKLSRKQGAILRFLCEYELWGRRGKNNHTSISGRALTASSRSLSVTLAYFVTFEILLWPRSFATV
jgi:hypothetical protein